MKKTINLLWRCASSPSSVFEEIKTDPRPLKRALWLYAAAICASVISDLCKPAGFPQADYQPVSLAASVYTNGILGAVNTAACVIFLASFMAIGKKLSKPLFVLSSAVMVGAPLIALAFIMPSINEHGAAFGAALLVWFALACLPARDSGFRWREAASVLVLSNVFALFVLPFDIASSLARNESVYKAAQYVAGFWMLWFSITGIKKTENSSTPLAAAGIIGSMLMGLGLLGALGLLGLISREHMNAMMSL